MSQKVDLLSEDKKINGQNYFCVSFLSPEGVKNTSLRAIKIRGVYNTYEEAKKRSEELGKDDQYFDIYVGEIGKWLAWNPDPTTAENVQYAEDDLNNLMHGYHENANRADKINDQRKKDKVGNATKINKEDKDEDLKLYEEMKDEYQRTFNKESAKLDENNESNIKKHYEEMKQEITNDQLEIEQIESKLDKLKRISKTT